LMEIADVLVLNKADHPGADAMEAALRSSLAYRGQGGWKPPIVRTVGIERKGIDAMHAALLEHRAYVGRPEVKPDVRRAKARLRLRNAVREGLLTRWFSGARFEAELDRAADRVLSGDVSPHRAARDLMERITRDAEHPS
jgi:LAO/AO transport system kinase